jgi:hypothetical protein
VPPRSGCGRIISAFFKLVLLAFLLVLLGVVWLVFQKIASLSAPDRSGTPAFTDTFDAYDPAQTKIAAFQTELQADRPSSLRLSATEVNALLSRSDLSLKHNIFFFFTFTGTEARLQASLPAEDISLGLARGRFFNLDMQFTPSLDHRTRSLVLKPETFVVSGQPFLGAGVKRTYVASYAISQIAAAVTAEMRKDSTGRKILEDGRRVEIEDGQLVIETQ